MNKEEDVLPSENRARKESNETNIQCRPNSPIYASLILIIGKKEKIYIEITCIPFRQ